MFDLRQNMTLRAEQQSKMLTVPMDKREKDDKQSFGITLYTVGLRRQTKVEKVEISKYPQILFAVYGVYR